MLGLTTTLDSDWRKKCEEIDELGLTKVALFPTFLGIEERKELYGLLEHTGIRELPHVHLRSDDTEAWEMELFEKRYSTKAYNIHPQAVDAAVLAPYMHKIFVENQYEPLEEKDVIKCAGMCLDFSHIEDARVQKATVGNPLSGLLGKYPVGCCHISLISSEQLAEHYMKDLHELDYLIKYAGYFPDLISLEMENPFVEQLQAKEYIEKVLKLI